MAHNPYTPPATQELEIQEITFLREIVPRPVAVWILIATLVIFIVIFFGDVARLLWTLLSRRDDIRNVAGAVLTTAWFMLVIAVLAFLSVCVYRGFHWSRWLGIVTIVGFAAIGFLRPDATHYANEAQRTGGFIGRMVLSPLLFVWWTYAFGFSSKARRYFSQHSQKGA